MHDDGVNCRAVQQALREGRELIGEQSVHFDECEACRDAYMDAWLTAALDAKPEVAIPADFAARVAAMAPARPEKRARVRTPRYWGVISAMAIVTVILIVCFASSKPANSWVSLVLVMLVTAEIAGLALWLGPTWIRR